MTRSAVKQIRTLEFEITLAPRPNRQENHHRSGGGASGRRNYGQSDTQHEFDAGVFGDYGDSIVQQPQRVIDAQNEQEFPSLGGSSGASSFSMRPNVSIRTQSYGSAGLARTKENFPALGGGATSSSSTSNGAAAPASGSYRQGTASALLKQKPTAATGAINKQPGMVIHVSNRPTSSSAAAAAATTTKKSAKDFPSLPGTSKKSLLEQDFVAPTAASAYSNNISAKHRNLFDGYEPMADAVAKLALVKAAPAPPPPQPQRANKQPETVPKINSKNNFPSLGGNAPGAAMAPQWVSLSKKAPVESRKSKVAPPPLSSAPPAATSYPALAEKQQPTVKVPTKAAAVKAKAPAAAVKQAPPPPSVQQQQSAKQQAAKNAKKVQKYHDAGSDDDTAANDYQSATVLSAVSAKHRSLVDSYESVAKTGGTKLSMVQRSEAKVQSAAGANVPKLNSRDNFPSLSAGAPEPNNNHAKGINFLDILKNNGEVSPTKHNGNNNNNATAVTTNGSAGPPPGFGTTGGESNKAAQPPPGFKSVTLNSVAKPPTNDLTFTTSMGESFSIMPAQHTYLPPPNASKRNQVRFLLFVFQ